jgi:hypothetical protein
MYLNNPIFISRNFGNTAICGRLMYHYLNHCMVQYGFAKWLNGKVLDIFFKPKFSKVFLKSVNKNMITVIVIGLIWKNCDPGYQDLNWVTFK